MYVSENVLTFTVVTFTSVHSLNDTGRKDNLQS